MALDFSVISVRQMIASKPQPQKAPNSYLPLFLVNLAHKEKPSEVSQVTSPSHVVIKVEAYTVETGITQC